MAPVPTAEQLVTSCQHVLPALGLDRVGQLGFLVDDVEPWCRKHGTELGVETWYRPTIRRCKHFVEGRRLDQRFDIVVGYAGGVQIEVLHVDGADAERITPPPSSEPPQLHHVGVFVDEMAATRDRLAGKGYPALQSGLFSFARWSKTRVAYLDTTTSLGVIVELIENRFMKWRIDLPEWFVRLGTPMGFVTRL